MANKIYKRKILAEVEKYLDSKHAIVIVGARQVGKTTFLEYLMENVLKENYFYFDLEIARLRELCDSGPESAYRHLLQSGADAQKRIFLLVDEVQRLADPTSFIKIMHDHYHNVKLIVSGSSAFEMRKKFRNSLAGRTVTFELYPLSFEEFLEFKGKTYRLLAENQKTINDELAALAREYIRFGGYPAIVLEQDEGKKLAFLSQIIDTYVKKDIRDLGEIRNVAGFNRLLEALASQSGQLLNATELSGTLSISRETVLQYLDLLEWTFIIRRIRPFHRNLRSELSKNPKVFFMDTGMMHVLWLKQFPEIIHGNSFETFVFLELAKAGVEMGFWRTTNRQEVDFVLPEKNLAVEAKCRFGEANGSALMFFKKEYGFRAEIASLEGEKKNGKYVWELIKELEG